MRALKFRAWQTVTKTMFMGIEKGTGDTYNPFPPFADYLENRHMVIMQFTGLLDRNGNEIYEGDIVRINHPQDRTGDFTNAIGEVLWWEEEGGFYHGNNHGRPPKRMWNYVEVIGNIYQHPDLLEGGKS